MRQQRNDAAETDEQIPRAGGYRFLPNGLSEPRLGSRNATRTVIHQRPFPGTLSRMDSPCARRVLTEDTDAIHMVPGVLEELRPLRFCGRRQPRVVPVLALKLLADVRQPPAREAISQVGRPGVSVFQEMFREGRASAPRGAAHVCARGRDFRHDRRPIPVHRCEAIEERTVGEIRGEDLQRLWPPPNQKAVLALAGVRQFERDFGQRLGSS
jgi:hypothetical protein